MSDSTQSQMGFFASFRLFAKYKHSRGLSSSTMNHELLMICFVVGLKSHTITTFLE